MSGSRPSHKDDKDAFNTYIIDPTRKPEEIREIYNEWAKDYEADAKTDAYDGPATFAEEFDKLGLPKDSKILDVCCGTGLFGKLLRTKGYTNIHGVDGSPGMLSMAKSQDVYQSYEECILIEGTKTSFADDTFDALLVCGALGPGHLGPDAFPELIRITKPGGIIGWLAMEYKAWIKDPAKDEAYRKDYDQRMAKLVDGKKWKVYKERIVIKNMYKGEPGFIDFMQVL